MSQKGVIIESPVSLRKANFQGHCRIGCFSYFSGHAEVGHADIGRYCSIASGVIIGPGNHPLDHLSTHPFAFGGGSNRFARNSGYAAIVSQKDGNAPTRRTSIGNDVWIGANAIIMQGVTIGNGSMIAAGAVVTKDVEAFSIVGGVPAKTLRSRFPEEIASRIQKLEWWNHSLDRKHVGELCYGDLEKTLSALEELKDSGQLPILEPPTRKVGRRWHQRLFITP